MRTVGLIAEYNPFHNGHAWHMQEAKRISDADFCIVVMSGNFVQRGAPAILDKYARAKMALACGADLALELPVSWALGSAEYFASGAVSLLESLGVVDSLCFGSECGELTPLYETAQILNSEPEGYRLLLKKNLKAGKSFPLARADALEQYLSDTQLSVSSLLREPNNILGIEYLKALIRLDSRIQPFTISRAGGAYHSSTLHGIFSSATALRKLLGSAEISKSFPCGGFASPESPISPLPEVLEHEMPRPAYKILQGYLGKSCPVNTQDFSALLHYRLLSVNSPGELTDFQDVSAELADRIFRLIPEYEDFEQFISLIKTKQYTESRISRCLFHILLDIRRETVQAQKDNGWNSYARVLGLRKKSSPLLHEIKERSRIPLITKLADAQKLLTPEQMGFLKKDIYASEVFQCVDAGKFKQGAYSEYRRQIILWDES